MWRLLGTAPRLAKMFWDYGRVFSVVGKKRMALLIAMSAVAALLEGLGLAMFFPLLSSEDSQSMAASNVGKMVNFFFSLLGIPQVQSSALVFMLLFFTGKGILRYFEVRTRGRMTADFQAQLQISLFEKVCKLRFEKFLLRHRGALTNLLTVEVQASTQALSEYCQILGGFAILAAYSLLAMFLSWKLALAGVFFGIFFALIQKPLSKHSSQGAKRFANTQKSMGAQIFEVLASYKYLRASTSAKAFAERVLTSAARLKQERYFMVKFDAASAGLYQPLAVLTLVCLIGWDSKFNGSAVLGSLVSLGIIYRVMGTLNSLQVIWNNFVLNRGHLDFLIQEQESLEADLEVPAPLHCHGSWSQPFEARHLSATLGTKVVLSDVSFKIEAGSFVAMVGPSGSGKSTLLDVLAGLHHAEHGEFFFGGQKENAAVFSSLRHEIGFVTQDVPIFGGTVLENLGLSTSEPMDLEWAQDCLRAAGAGFFLDYPQGLSTKVGDGNLTLSGGQRQRLALARELYKKPKILFLDEATSALDAENEHHVIENLYKFAKQTSIVLVTHRLRLLEHADQIYVMDDGKIVESGKYSQLVEQEGLFAKLLSTSRELRTAPALRIMARHSHRIYLRSDSEVKGDFELANISKTGMALYISELASGNFIPGQIVQLSLDSSFSKFLGAKVAHTNAGHLGLAFLDQLHGDFLKLHEELEKTPLGRI